MVILDKKNGYSDYLQPCSSLMDNFQLFIFAVSLKPEDIIMKVLYLICAGLLLLGLAAMPIGYYTVLRIIVTITSVIIVAQQLRNGVSLWVIIFGFIAILFNPVIPVHLNSKAAWGPIDIICAILFIMKAFIRKN